MTATSSAAGSAISVVAAELAAFRGTRCKTLGMVEGLSDERLGRRPAPDRWSIGEILDHMVLAEALYRDDIDRLIALARDGRRPSIRRTFRDIDVSILFIPRSLLPLLEVPFSVIGAFVPRAVREALARARWLPVQNPTVAEPRPGRPGAELRRELETSLEATERRFAAAGDLSWDEMTVSHPLLGTNDVPSLVRLMDRHEQRHQDQLREVLAATGS